MVGSTVGHYRILEKLGGGGMGVVYKAENLRLGSLVALKVLPEEMLARQDKQAAGIALERFKREARAASALNHPNICTIYDIDEHEGQPFIVMEYLEGQTLRQRMAVGETPLVPAQGRPQGAPLQIDTLLDLAIQTTDGLEAAHQKGIIHRDIKPANIFITTRGQAKILDFGLAKLSLTNSPRPPGGEGDRLRRSGEGVSPHDEPTATIDREHLTISGSAVGTMAYMSPEQARGEEVDARTDLFSFGAVLYEMVTGRMAFSGNTIAMIFDAILHHAPAPAAQLNPDLPPKLEEIINKALEKDRDLRYQSATELRSDLKRLKRDTDSARVGAGLVPAPSPAATVPVPAGHPQGVPRRRRWPLALVGLLVLVLGATIGYRFFQPGRKTAAPPMRVVPFTSFPGREEDGRFSPDGNQIAFDWNGEKEDNWDIYVKLIGAEKPLRLTTDPGEDTSPAWSPDGRYIAFLRHTEHEDAIYVVPALGGAERKVHSLSLGALAIVSVDWSPDGKYLAYVDRGPGEAGRSIFLLAVENPDETRALTSPHGPIHFDYGPRFSPDGRTLAFMRAAIAGEGDIHTIPVAGGEPRRLTFDKVAVAGLDWTPDAASIIFSSERGGDRSLWKVPASGGEPDRLSVGQGHAFSPVLSRDGHRLAYIQESGDANIWRYEISNSSGQRPPPTKLIASTEFDGSQQFSPDGKRIVFASGRSGTIEIWVCDSDGSNARQLTFLGGRGAGTPRWSPDSRQIAFDASPEGNSDIFVVSAEGGRPRRLTTETSSDGVPSWSQDGKWIYFKSDRTGAWQTWKMPSEGGRAVQVTKRGGYAAFESMDGKTLYYAKGLEVPGLWQVPVEGGEETRVIEQLGAFLWGYWAVVEGGIYFTTPTRRASNSSVWPRTK